MLPRRTPRDLDSDPTQVLMAILNNPNPWPPSFRELLAAVGWRDHRRMHNALLELRKCKLVTWEIGKTRTIKPLVYEPLLMGEIRRRAKVAAHG